eukprot:4955717-Prymnesium_polylepis.1
MRRRVQDAAGGRQPPSPAARHPERYARLELAGRVAGLSGVVSLDTARLVTKWALHVQREVPGA